MKPLRVVLAWIIVVIISIPHMSTAEKGAEGGVHLLEAVKITLANQPDIFLQEQQTETSKGILQTETGLFDTRLDASIVQDRDGDRTTHRISIDKLFRTGILISPGVRTDRFGEPYSDFDPVADGRVDLIVSIPLMRGLGAKATGAGEMAARSEYDASLLDLHQTVSEKVLDTVVAYWNYLGARKRLDELTASEARARVLVEETKTLIEWDERPAADLQQPLANHADKIAARIAGEQSLFEARQNLGITMGLSQEHSAMLSGPSDPFPELDRQGIEQLYSASGAYVEGSLERRADYLASQKRQDTASILVDAARNGLKPQLDLDLYASHLGLKEDYYIEDFFDNFERTLPGSSLAFSLRYSFPVQNNSARGALRQSISAQRQSVIRTMDLARNIRSNVAVAISALKNSSLELTKSQEAVRLYRLAAENEKEKLRLGTSTLLDVIDIEDRLTAAILNELSAYQKFANALARLRFETGTILSGSRDEYAVSTENLLSIPKDLVSFPEKDDGRSGGLE